MGLGSRLDRRLAVRLLAMLTLALLPLGIIAILQTYALTASVRDAARASQLARAEQTVQGERRVVFAALGASAALSAALPQLNLDRAACHRHLHNLVSETPQIASASYAPTSGEITCASENVTMDISAWPAFRALLENPRIRVETSRLGAMSEQRVVVITRPVYRKKRLEGFVSVSVPYETVTQADDGRAAPEPLSTLLFNTDGDVVTYSAKDGSTRPEIPRSVRLQDFVDQGPQIFEGRAPDGTALTHAVVPLIHGSVYAMSTWPAEVPRQELLAFAPITWPLAMLVASLMVGYLAVHRLVIRHVGSLKRDMRAFAMHRTLAAEEPDPRMSAELADIKTEFLHMADSLLRDEAALEDALREKNELLEQKTVLMKEVHHRVKNNLQLISSIMNMQMRKAENPETRAVLSRLQDRIIGLAAVHRDLYQAGASGAVDASALVSQIANQLLGSGEAPDLQMHSNYDEIVLYPDQAVPLALLAAEALTNATKYAEAPDPDSAPRVEVSFLRDAGDTVTFEVSNTVADGARSHGPTGDGLGAKLIEAFARQLEGELFSGRDGRAHVVRLTFKVANFRPAADEDNS